MLELDMLEFYASSNPKRLTHKIFTASDFEGRKNIVSPEEFLQVSAIALSENEEFKAHVHDWKECSISETVAQEAWVVIAGEIEAYLYDDLEALVGVATLKPGDCCITLHGGHKYKANSEAVVYEFKSGPYLGDLLDKHYIL